MNTQLNSSHHYCPHCKQPSLKSKYTCECCGNDKHIFQKDVEVMKQKKDTSEKKTSNCSKASDQPNVIHWDRGMKKLAMNKTEKNIVKELNTANRSDELIKTKKLSTRAIFKCPLCNSENIMVHEAKRNFLNISNAMWLLGGLLIIAFAWFLEAPEGWLEDWWPLFKLLGYIMGVLLIWDRALGLRAPPPFIWFEDYGQKTYRIWTKCDACDGYWSKVIRLRYLEQGEFAD